MGTESPNAAVEKEVKRKIYETAERYAARIPGRRLSGHAKSLQKGWALLGDAAGFTDPLPVKELRSFG